jgi:hypothetical protein
MSQNQSKQVMKKLAFRIQIKKYVSQGLILLVYEPQKSTLLPQQDAPEMVDYCQ